MRHEDDIRAESAANEGQVSLLHLVEHLESVIGNQPAVYGETTAKVAWAAAEVISELAEQLGLIMQDETARLELPKLERLMRTPLPWDAHNTQ